MGTMGWTRLSTSSYILGFSESISLLLLLGGNALLLWNDPERKLKISDTSVTSPIRVPSTLISFHRGVQP